MLVRCLNFTHLELYKPCTLYHQISIYYSFGHHGIDLRFALKDISESTRTGSSYKNKPVSLSLASLSVLRIAKPPVYHDCFMVEECKKSARR